MFKSSFARYITAFAIIILVSFLMLTSLITIGISQYAKDVREKDVLILARISATLVEDAYRDSTEDRLTDFAVAEETELHRLLASVPSHDGDVSFFLTDPDGTILSAYVCTEGAETAERIPAPLLARLQKDGGYSESGRLDGTLGRDHLVCAVPVCDVDGNTIGAIFACASNADEDALVSMLNKSILLSNLWIMLAMMVAIYFITERLLAPIREMRQAAKEFSNGNFSTRIHVVGGDEVAECARTFNVMAESLEKSEQLRSTFLANVSHDLRTPMTTIAGFVDGILDGAIPQEDQEYYLRIVSEEIHRLSRLVSQLLDLSRMQVGVRQFTPSDFDICEVARLILISFETKINEKNLEIDFDTEDDRMLARADRDAIHQIVYNLTENAVKFSRPGGRLKISIHPGERGKYNFTVYNEGSGIPKEDLPYIFDRFYKSDKSRGLDKIGVGLGLYIVKTILTANGENIWAESEEGAWCSFTFTIARIE